MAAGEYGYTTKKSRKRRLNFIWRMEENSGIIAVDKIHPCVPFSLFLHAFVKFECYNKTIIGSKVLFRTV